MQDSEDLRAIQGVVDDWISANKRCDTQAVLDLVTDDAVFMVSGQPSMTKTALAAACAVRVEQGLTFEGVSDIKEIRVEGTMAYSLSHLTVTTRTRAGADLRRSFHTLTVFRKVDGRWRIARDANVSVRA